MSHLNERELKRYFVFYILGEYVGCVCTNELLDRVESDLCSRPASSPGTRVYYGRLNLVGKISKIDLMLFCYTAGSISEE